MKHPAHSTARAGFTRCGARTRDHRREATLLLLLVLQSGAAVAVVWAHARTHELRLWPLGGGHTYHVEGHTTNRLRNKQALTSTVSQ